MQKSIDTVVGGTSKPLPLADSADHGHLLLLLDARQKIDAALVAWEKAWTEYSASECSNLDLIHILSATRKGVSFSLPQLASMANSVIPS